MNKTLLLDTDTFLYKTKYYFDTLEKNGEKIEKDFMRDYLIKKIEKMKKDTSTNDILLCYSDINNFRSDILKSYKYTRNKGYNTSLETIKNTLNSLYENKTIHNLEADDILSYFNSLIPEKYIISSTDKDLKQCAGILYNWDKETIETISKTEGDLFFKKQCIIGDSADFYSGIPGIGEKRSIEILENCLNSENFWIKLIEYYEFFGLDYYYLLKIARVAKLLDKELYNLDTGNIKMYSIL